MDSSRASQGRMVRARMVISGRVQGVYFRASARDMARAQGLSGWVRNRLDGDVEAVVEGEAEAVQAFIAWCREGPPGAYVSDVRATMDLYTGEFQGFRVVA
ncbi:MAG TPA: acylphosphatase [Candidatus Tectomicrobia bacterium]|nr:acylphosphatase [Candidatus Tectomicrobia bacterium]